MLVGLEFNPALRDERPMYTPEPWHGVPFRIVRLHPSLEEGLSQNWQVPVILYFKLPVSDFIDVVSTAVELLNGNTNRTDGRTDEAISTAAVQLRDGT